MTTLTAAAERLTSSMLDSKRMFKDEDYPRLLRTALAALNAVRPLHKVGRRSWRRGRRCIPVLKT